MRISPTLLLVLLELFGLRGELVSLSYEDGIPCIRADDKD